LAGKPPFLWTGVSGNEKRLVFRIRNSAEKLRRKPAFLPSQHLTSEILLPGRVVNPKTGQIREKTGTNILDIPDLWPVLAVGHYSGAENGR